MTTRREFLTNLAAIHLAGLKMAVPISHTLPPPYGPAERTAHIDKCAQLVDETIQALEKFLGCLLDSRALPPEQVDGVKLLTLENEAHAATDNLAGTIEGSTEFEEVFKWATGKRAWYWCLKHDIIGNAKYEMDRDDIQLEIDAFRPDEPAIADELQALLNAKVWGCAMTPLETEMLSFLSTAGGGQSLLTRHTYHSGLAYFRRYLSATQGWQDDTPIADLGPDAMWEFPSWLLKQTYSRGHSAAPSRLAETTRELYLLSVSRFIRFLILRRRLPLFDFIEYEILKEEFCRATNVKAEPIARKIPAEAAIRAVVEVARIPRTFNRKTLPSGRYRLTLIWYRNLAIVLSLKSSGMRVGELVSLKRGDLDYDRQGAWVTGKGRKTRFVAFDDEAWTAIKEYLEQRNDEGVIAKHPLFCRHDRHVPAAARLPMTTRAVQHVIEELAADAAIGSKWPGGPNGPNQAINLHPHSFRHYFANKLLAYTGNLALVQEALGHQDPKTTRIYTAVKADDIAKSVQALGAATSVEGGAK